MRALHAGRCSKLLATARSSRAASAVSAFSLYCEAACARKSSPGNSGKVAVEPGVAVESSTPEAMVASVPNERVDGPSATTERERQWDSGRFAPTL